MSLILNPYFGALTQLTFVGRTQSSTGTVNISGIAIASGDLCIIMNTLQQGSPVAATPSGFTQLADLPSGGFGGAARVSYKILTGSETNISSGSTGTDEVMFALVLRPNSGISSVTPSTWNGQVTNDNPSLQTVNPTAVTTPVVVLGVTCSQSSSYDFSTASPAFTEKPQAIFGGTAARYGYIIYNSSPASHSIDIDDEGFSNVLLSGYVAVS